MTLALQRPGADPQLYLKKTLTNNYYYDILSTEREVIKMTYEEALKELEKLMKENEDVLIRLKNA